MSYSDNENLNSSSSDQSMDDLIADLSEPVQPKAGPNLSKAPTEAPKKMTVNLKKGTAASEQPVTQDVPVPGSAVPDPFAQPDNNDPFAQTDSEEGGTYDPFGFNDLAGDSGTAGDTPIPFGGTETPDAAAGTEEPVPAEVLAQAKRGKKVKAPRTKTAKTKVPRNRVPWNKSATVIAFYGLFLLLGLLAVNAGAFVQYGMDSIIFLIVFDILGLILLLVPWLLLGRVRYGEYLSFFDVALGMSLSFVVVACMVMLGVQSAKYGLEIKPTGNLPVKAPTPSNMPPLPTPSDSIPTNGAQEDAGALETMTDNQATPEAAPEAEPIAEQEAELMTEPSAKPTSPAETTESGDDIFAEPEESPAP